MKHAEFFQHPVETWDTKKCLKMSRRTATDGMGTPYGFKGAVPELPKTQRFNGGCCRNGVWYPGEEFQLPILAAGFSWVYVPT